MRSFPLQRTALILPTGMLALVASWGCSVDVSAPPAFTALPGLEPQNTDGGGGASCKGPQYENYTKLCSGGHPEACCNAGTCNIDYLCGKTTQQCTSPGHCAEMCITDMDCITADPDGGLVCRPGTGLCLPKGCTSNRDCVEGGQLCEEESGDCVAAPIEDKPEPGCSAVGTRSSSGALLGGVLSALLLATARARRRAR